MSARPVIVAALAACAALSACRGPRPHPDQAAEAGHRLHVPDRLDCPETVGALTRTSVDPDGQACGYDGERSARIRLRRVMVGPGGPQGALGAIEAELTGGSAGVRTDAPGAGESGDVSNVDLPGIHIRTQGDKSDVDVFGITVHDDGGRSNVNVGSHGHLARVEAGPDGSVVRVADVGPQNARLALVRASDTPLPGGYKVAGYLARGPVAGPLAVATFQAPEKGGDWRSNSDLEALLNLNAKP